MVEGDVILKKEVKGAVFIFLFCFKMYFYFVELFLKYDILLKDVKIVKREQCDEFLHT